MYRISFINSMRTWGGAEVWFLETALALTDSDCRVDIVAQPGSELLRRARLAGLQTRAIPIRFDGAPWTVAALRRHFKGCGTRAILANLTKDLKAAAVAGRLAKVPVILGTRESDFPLKSKPYYRWYFNHLATGLLVNSRATRDTVLDSAPWLDPERVHLLPKGIDVDRFRPSPFAARPVVGFAGQLIERKGIRYLMDAWDRLERADVPGDPILRLAGDGPLRGALEQWRDTLDQPDRVEILGLVEDMPAFYAGISVLVMPSLIEGFGLVAAEAGACGRPVIASDASSLPEIVVNGETGILVSPADSGALADALVKALRHPSSHRELGMAARDHIVRHYSRDTMLTRLRHLLAAPEG